MLSSFVRNTVKGGRRKGNKGAKPSPSPTQSQVQHSPATIESFASPDVFDIHEKAHDHHPHDTNSYSGQDSLVDSTAESSLRSRSLENSPQVQLDLPETETDWTQELLQCGRATPTLSSDWTQAIFRRQNGGSSPRPEGTTSSSERSMQKAASSESLRRGPRAPRVVEPEPIDVTPDLPSAGTTSADSSSTPASSTWKKSIPAPITIPDRDRLVPAVLVPRSNSTIPEPVPKEGVPRASTLTSRQPSPISSSDDASAVSGTTLARALIANAFTLSSSDTRSSRYKAMMTRQDSATLPRGEQPAVASPFWRDRRISGGEIVLDYESQTGSIAPPVPPVPPGAGAIFLDQKRGASVADKRHSDSQLRREKLILTSPPSTGHDLAFIGSPENSTYIETSTLTQIPELPSPAPTIPKTPGSLEAPKTANSVSSPSPLGQSTTSLAETSSAPASASQVPLPPSSKSSEAPSSGTPSLDTAKKALHRRTHSDPSSPSPTDHSLDDYQFVSPGSVETLASESSASYRTSPRPRRPESRFVGSIGMSLPTNTGRIDRLGPDPRLNVHRRNRKQVTLLPIGDRHQSLMQVPQTPITPGVASLAPSQSAIYQQVPMSAVPAGTLEMPLTSRSSTMDTLITPISGPASRRKVPSRIRVGREDDDLSEYLTISPEASLHYRGSESTHDYPTFPETPQVFTPLYSPDYYFAPNSIASGRRKGGRTATLATVVDEPKESSEPVLTRSMTLNFQPGSLSVPPSPSSSSPRRRSTYEVKHENGSPHSPTTIFPLSPVHRRTLSATASPTTSIRPSPLSHVTIYEDENSSKQTSQETPPPASAPSVFTSHHDPDDYEPEHSNTNLPFSSSELSPAAIPLPDSATPSPQPPPSSTGSVSPLPTPSIPHSASLYSAPLSGLSQPGSFVPDLGSSVESSPIEYMGPPLPSERMRSASPSQAQTLDSRQSSLSQHSGESSPSFTPSFVAPPAYHDVVNDRDRPPRLSLEEDGQGHHHPQFFTETPPAHMDQHEHEHEHEHEHDGVAPHEHVPDHLHPLSAHSYHSEHSNSSPRARIRSRPAMPIGPRKPSGPIQPLGPLTRDRNGSVSSLGHGRTGSSGTSWRKLYAAASAPPPKFQPPPLKYRTLTHEAAQWTLSSSQLQEIVSRAIKQTAEATSIRLLRLENLDQDIPEDVHRLELQRTDIKARYKMMMRKRWSLMGALATHVDGAETCDAVTAARTLEELAEVSSALDHLTEELHRVSEQLAQLKSLRDIHAASALAMALRKLNASFLKQVSEVQNLHERIGTLEAERDEAWKHAEDAAQDCDALEERLKAEGSTSNANSSDVTLLSDTKPAQSNRRSLRISAVRKSSVRASKAGLRSKRTSTSSTRNSLVAPSSGIRSNFSIEDIPPVPPLPFGASMGAPPFLNGPAKRASGVSSAQPSSSGARALMQVQRELYDMLGLSSPDFRNGQDSPSRPRSASGFSPRRPSVHTRPLSEISSSWAHRPRSSMGFKSAYSSVPEEERQALLATLGMLDRD